MKQDFGGQIILVDSDALFQLVAEVVKQIQKPDLPEWIDEKEAMGLLKISSKSHLWKLRSEGKLDFFQDDQHRKVILYSRASIMDYLEKNRKRSF